MCQDGMGFVGDGFPVPRAAKRRPYNADITIAPLNNNLPHRVFPAGVYFSPGI